ncbi:MAG TPA: DMT family transporter [Candidatus Acidoferrales bacterium]|nr:DMT family transporter [Candidatus Acidoferrales bacterium]
MSLRTKAHCVLLLCSFLWGVTFVVVKDALADISVFGYLAARFLLGALPLIWIYRHDLRKLTRDEAWAGVQLGLLMFGGYAFQTAGIARTTPSKAAFITGLSVVLVPVFLAAFWRKKIGAAAWMGAAASFVGLYLLTVPVEGIVDLNRGDVLVMGCAVLYGFQIIYIARYTGKYSLGALSCLQVILAGVLSAIAVPVLNVTHVENFFVRYTFQMEFGVIVTAIFTTALAYPLLVWGQKHTTATNTALILTSEPVFAAITSFVVLHERLGGRPLAGAILILGGICIAEWKGTVPAGGA